MTFNFVPPQSMNKTNLNSSFCVVGVSYHRTDAPTRGLFSLDEHKSRKLSEKASQIGASSLMIVSTCNRTELYAEVENEEILVGLLCEFTKGTKEMFAKHGYIKTEEEAIDHVFQVGTGLDSQILGDFEIIAQIKKSFKQAKKSKLTSAFLERLCNSVIQASKRIKNETEISTGATSVSFASVKYLMQEIPEVQSKKIVLFGTGKIGRNTCENLVKHTKNQQITLINRTRDRAEEVAGKFKVDVKSFSDLPSEIRTADVLIVATGAANPTVNKDLLRTKNNLLILDLSVPQNVASDVTEIDGVSLVGIDQLSKITDDTLERRKQYIPQALAIIEEIQADFIEWLSNRKFAPVVAAVKAKLQSYKNEEIDFHSKKNQPVLDEKAIDLVSNRLIQKITKQIANHLKSANGDFDQSVAMLNDVFELNQKESNS